MEKLKLLREERGLSQVKLAARADLNPATVNQIERGMRKASPGTLHKLANALDISLYELLEEDAPKAPRSSSRTPEAQAGEGRDSTDPWKGEYEKRGDEMFGRWEDELEQKVDLLASGESAAFFVWLQGVRDVGHPYVRGLIAAYASTANGKLDAVMGMSEMTGRWRELWHRIEEATESIPGQKMSKEDEEHLQWILGEVRPVR